MGENGKRICPPLRQTTKICSKNLTVGARCGHKQRLRKIAAPTNLLVSLYCQLPEERNTAQQKQSKSHTLTIMGCASSKLLKKEFHRDIILNNDGDYVNHVVSLTSSTYGALKLDNKERQRYLKVQQVEEEMPIKDIVEEIKRKQRRSPPRDEPEVIDACELMGDLEEVVPVSSQLKKSPNTRALIRGVAEIDARSPLKFLNHIGSPRKAKTFGGKENKVKRLPDFSPAPFLKGKIYSGNSKAVMRLSYPMKASTPVGPKLEIFSGDYGVSSRSRSFSPLFDPELVALYEKELFDEGEQIKRIISATPRSQTLKNSRDLELILESFEQKCPPGGENAVVVYTTTLRGIRKTFEDCNTVRSIVESHRILLIERDVSMDSGFKEELRALLGKREVKVPLLFVKGRLIGGADQVVKLEEEGKLGILFGGVPRGLNGECEGCAGVRFLMCMKCNGSCKMLDVERKKMVKCGQCNENGLIQCPLCC